MHESVSTVRGAVGMQLQSALQHVWRTVLGFKVDPPAHILGGLSLNLVFRPRGRCLSWTQPLEAKLTTPGVQLLLMTWLERPGDSEVMPYI